MIRRLVWVLLVSFGVWVVWAVPVFAASCPSWTVVSSPNPAPRYNLLIGVAARSSTDAWAVGVDGRRQHALVEHWNGVSWRRVASPSPAPRYNNLNSVAVISANDAWAVGVDGIKGHTLVEHWNGSRWTHLLSPDGGRSASGSFLQGVSALSRTDVWAVGGYTTKRGKLRTLVEHWNGTRWAIVRTATVPGGLDYLTSVSALAANDVWVAGSVGASPTRPLLEHWNGASWRRVAAPSVNSDAGFDGFAAAGGDLWAVATIEGGHDRGLIDRSTGGAWATIPSPSTPHPTNLSGVAAVSANDVWTVGRTISTNSERVLVMHWNGSHWALVSAPNPRPADEFLGVTAIPGTQKVWAVGGTTHTPNGGIGKTLIERGC